MATTDLWGGSFSTGSTGMTCGTGGWSGPKPGDPSNNAVLQAVPAYGGIDVSWTYPTTNPFAVAHTILYRGTTSNFAQAIEIAVVSGNFYYDKSTVSTPVTYYYWIKLVSVNGTYGDLIGPASAQAKPLIADMISQLTGQINEGTLANGLKTHLTKVDTFGNNLISEIENRIAANRELSLAIGEVQSGLVNAMTYIQTETTRRTTENSALLSQVTTLAAAVDRNLGVLLDEKTLRINADSAMASRVDTLYLKVGGTDGTGGLTAAIETEKKARIDADSAFATKIDTLFITTGQNSSGIRDINTTKIGYSATLTGNYAFDGDGVTIVYPVSKYPAADYPDYVKDRTRIIDAVGVREWNATAAGASKPLIWISGMPLASAVKTVGVTGPDGSYATLEQGFTAQKILNDRFKAQYTAKVDVNGLVGGFGIYNDGVTVEAGFDVNRFWIGSATARRKPFIVENNVVYIDDAAINKLTFSKLRDESGSVVVENGKLKANYISVKRVTSGGYDTSTTDTTFSFPPAGQSGFYLGPFGLALGDKNNEKYFVVTSSGDMYLPGMECVGGNLKINKLEVIDTLQVRGNAITNTQSGESYVSTNHSWETPWKVDHVVVDIVPPVGRILYPAKYIVIFSLVGGASGNDTSMAARVHLTNKDTGVKVQIADRAVSVKNGFTQSATFMCTANVTVASNLGVRLHLDVGNTWNNGSIQISYASLAVFGAMR